MKLKRNLLLLSFLIIKIAIGQESYESTNERSENYKATIHAQLPFSKISQDLRVEVIDGLVIFEGDIVLGTEDILSDRAAALNGSRWPNGIIHYQLSTKHGQYADIIEAIDIVNRTTNLCLIKRIKQDDYVVFTENAGCSSALGRQGGAQNLSVNGCSVGSIIHEILHASGVFHEHTRQDRNTFITVNTANIIPARLNQFDIYPAGTGTDIGPYDYGSIMHYGEDFFTNNGLTL